MNHQPNAMRATDCPRGHHFEGADDVHTFWAGHAQREKSITT
jgi:hypothetical protein